MDNFDAVLELLAFLLAYLVAVDPGALALATLGAGLAWRLVRRLRIDGRFCFRLTRWLSGRPAAIVVGPAALALDLACLIPALLAGIRPRRIPEDEVRNVLARTEALEGRTPTARIEALEAATAHRMGTTIHERVEGLRADTNARFSALEDQISRHAARLEKIEAGENNLRRMYAGEAMDGIRARLAALEAWRLDLERFPYRGLALAGPVPEALPTRPSDLVFPAPAPPRPADLTFRFRATESEPLPQGSLESAIPETPAAEAARIMEDLIQRAESGACRPDLGSTRNARPA